MNLVEHYVLEVLGPPQKVGQGEAWEGWEVRVRAVCYGREEETTLYFKGKDPPTVEVGHEFLG